MWDRSYTSATHFITYDYNQCFPYIYENDVRIISSVKNLSTCKSRQMLRWSGKFWTTGLLVSAFWSQVYQIIMAEKKLKSLNSSYIINNLKRSYELWNLLHKTLYVICRKCMKREYKGAVCRNSPACLCSHLLESFRENLTFKATTNTWIFFSFLYMQCKIHN
jgi:hypothetical protein